MDKIVKYLKAAQGQEMTIKEGELLINMLNAELTDLFTLFTKVTKLKLNGIIRPELAVAVEEQHLYQIKMKGEI